MVTSRFIKRTSRKSGRAEGFDSNFEYEVWLAAGKIPVLHGETFTYTIAHKYEVDFVITNEDGSKIYIETKGYWKSKDRTKHLAVVSQNKGIDLRIVFQNPYQKLRKGSKQTYASWCDKHGITWAEKEIPKEWLAKCNSKRPAHRQVQKESCANKKRKTKTKTYKGSKSKR